MLSVSNKPIMLNAVMLNVVMLSIIMLSVVMVSVVVPYLSIDLGGEQSQGK
jgi:hypothetical protein